MSQPFFSQQFHNASKRTRQSRGVLMDPKDWPVEWHTTYYKEYPRFKQITLTPPSQTPLLTTQKDRQSVRDWKAAPSLDQLSQLLYQTAGEFRVTDGTRRVHASAGARYPIEVYALVRQGSDELAAGVYHYNIKDHGLDHLWDLDCSDPDGPTFCDDEWAEKAPVILVLTAVFWRSHNKYREFGYRFAMLEAGALMQNAYLAATEAKLGITAYNGTFHEVLESQLRLDTETESIMTCMLLGA